VCCTRGEPAGAVVPVATRDEGCTLGFDSPQRKGRVPRPLNASGIVLRSDNDKIIVHHGIALHAKPFRNEFLLFLPGVHKDQVGIAMALAATILLYISQAPARYFVEPGIPHPHGMSSRKKSSAPRSVRLSDGMADPLASGYLPLAAIAVADGWILVPSHSEGYPGSAEVVVRPWP